jgi:hypothetical protein
MHCSIQRLRVSAHHCRHHFFLLLSRLQVRGFCYILDLDDILSLFVFFCHAYLHIRCTYAFRSVGLMREGFSPARGSNMESLCRVLCSVYEFAELPVRHNEEDLNAQLASTLSWAVDPSQLGDAHTKTFLLLQAHFERKPLPISDYINDTKVNPLPNFLYINYHRISSVALMRMEPITFVSYVIIISLYWINHCEYSTPWLISLLSAAPTHTPYLPCSCVSPW